METTRTAAQAERQNERSHVSGQYTANPCHLCGKGCALTGYYSEMRSDLGTVDFGLVVHEGCAAKLAEMSDADFLAASVAHAAREAGNVAAKLAVDAVALLGIAVAREGKRFIGLLDGVAVSRAWEPAKAVALAKAAKTRAAKKAAR